MPDQTIPEFIRDANVDAVGWREAVDGDYLLLRDPNSRALSMADAYVIDGVPTWDDAGNLVAYSRRVQGHGTEGSYRKACNRVFSCTAFQVWRDFGRPEVIRREGIDHWMFDHVNLDDHEGSSLTVKVIDGDVVIVIDAGYIGDRGATLSYTIKPLADMASLASGLLTAAARACADRGANQ